MSIGILQFIFSSIFILLGIFVMSVSLFGVFKINYVMNRLHSSAMGDSLGIFLLIVGLIVLYGFSLNSLKLILIIFTFWCASPVCTHLLASLEIFTNQSISENCDFNDSVETFITSEQNGESVNSDTDTDF